jgi:hypothetical protein
MKKLLSIKRLEKVLFSYDSLDELIDDYNKMIRNGWEDLGEWYCKDNIYYQQYIKETNN